MQLSIQGLVTHSSIILIKALGAKLFSAIIPFFIIFLILNTTTLCCFPKYSATFKLSVLTSMFEELT